MKALSVVWPVSRRQVVPSRNVARHRGRRRAMRGGHSRRLRGSARCADECSDRLGVGLDRRRGGRLRWKGMDLPVNPPVLPMLANRVSDLPQGDQWIFEPKWDGFRTLIFRDGDELFIQSRD